MLLRFPKIRQCGVKCTGPGIVEVEFEGADNDRAEDSHQLRRGAAHPLTKTGLMIGAKPDAARKPVFVVLFNWLVSPWARAHHVRQLSHGHFVSSLCDQEENQVLIPGNQNQLLLQRIDCLQYLPAYRRAYINLKSHHRHRNIWLAPLLSSYQRAIP